jgi:hypothetical protein
MIDIEGDIEAMCRTSCTEQVEDVMVEGEDCENAYSRLQECLNSISCEEFQVWLAAEPGAECTEQESVFTDDCPGVEVRDASPAP